MAGRAYIGTSGWNYSHWADGVFYPKGLKQPNWLPFYYQHFDTVEINNTFYHLPQRSVFEHWYRDTPREFSFAVKASRFLTHMKKLADPEQHLGRFLANASALKEKLSVVLFQLPPYWKFNAERLEGLLACFQAEPLARAVRAALEIRHPSWNAGPCFEILRRHHVALVFADWPGLTITDPLTADFVFVRRHGPRDLYASCYSESHLRRDARHLRAWLSEGRDTYIYFNNDAEGYAVQNALRLRQMLRKQFPTP